MARAIDVHASLVQDRLTERELLARVASGLFRAPGVIKYHRANNALRTRNIVQQYLQLERLIGK